MQEAKDYVQILVDSLNKKILILEEILHQNILQAEAAGKETFDMEAFEDTVDKKDELINNLTALDNGFEAVYNRVRDELMKNRSSYADQIRSMQQIVRQIADKSVEVQASEARNKNLVETALRNARKQFGQGMTSVRAASDYYKNMSRVNYIDPQLMDTKK